MTSQPAIETSGLTKHYGEVRALIDLDLQVRTGEIGQVVLYVCQLVSVTHGWSAHWQEGRSRPRERLGPGGSETRGRSHDLSSSLF